ncbi:MAG: ABC transporter substrate-binding protein [Prevotellaceae bacterium]|jgi:iron complex transport system substrate-binding protein|nr:ABC transporter substrate-binding protein [Prevotellaceae bacterium]
MILIRLQPLLVFLTITALTLMTGCGNAPAPHKSAAGGEEVSYNPRHAKGFSIREAGDTTFLKVINPWQFASDVKFEYALVPEASKDDMLRIKVPVQRVVCMSTTHVAFVSALEQTDAICGISGVAHVSDSAVRRMYVEKKLFDVGYDAGLSYELLYSLRPDVVFAYGVKGEFAVVEKKLNELGIKVVYFGEYLEDTPLGKAEWLIPVSLFFGKREKAEILFDEIESDYELAKKTVADAAITKPKVMLNMPFKDVWYLPGNKGYMSEFLRDAGCNYIYSDYNERESYPASIEKAYALAQQADFWIIGDPVRSLNEIRRIDPRLAEIPAFKNGRVYNNNFRTNESGGNDFWEAGTVKPNLILRDLIKIFHPDLLPQYEFYFYEKLF